MALSAGARLGPYEILAPLGAGGMGEVYRARDPRLEREIAVKVLPEAAAGDADRLRRLEREARAASALNHPNIVTIHDIGEHAGTFYIAMELVEGRTLREILGEGALRPEKMLAFAVQIGDGLAKAHSAGIVHRDLKPENVMVTQDGLVKILDFGLAKLQPQAPEAGSNIVTATRATREGAVMGTVQYMSPEQAAGHPVDFRSDQFSFGSILYEMATGKLAFKRDTVPQTQTAIIEAEPEALRSEEVPAHFAAIVERCLAKNPEERYDSTRDLARELRSLQGEPSVRRGRRGIVVAAAALLAAGLAFALGLNLVGLRDRLVRDTAPGPIDSIAVLPLESLSGDPEQEYFADGMTDALISTLAQIGALEVVSRTSAMRYKQTDKPLPTIAAELDVDGVLEGSVLRAGGRVRITAQLVHAATDTPIWARSYERDLEDVLALQSEVARAIAEEIQIQLTPHEEARLAASRPVQPEAYDAYLRGRLLLTRRDQGTLTRAVEYFEQALELQEDYAPAYSALADSHVLLAEFQAIPANEAIPKAKGLAQNALRIDAALGEAHVSLAYARVFSWDWAGAEESFKRGIALNSSYATGHHWYGFFLTLMGRVEESIASQQRALRLDPLSLIISRGLGHRYFYARRYDEAIEAERQTLELDPNFTAALLTLGNAYIQKGMLEEGISTLQRATNLAGGVGWGDAPAVGFAYAVSGQSDKALQVLEEYGALDSAKGRHVSPYKVATIHLGLGDGDQALEWLERGYRESDPLLAYLNVEPLWDPLRLDPRFRDLLRRMDFPD